MHPLTGFLCFVVIDVCMARKQSIKVTGQVVCNDPIRVELRERDTLTPDDSLAEVKTDADGKFSVEGSEDELFNIEPYLRVHHKCGVKNPKCHRTTDVPVPQKQLTSGKHDAGLINLSKLAEKTKEVCDD
ncbi:TTR-15 protein [Aphelenchoides avenae]|nr:TTR-15 protein [Aphelenchus avenae]